MPDAPDRPLCQIVGIMLVRNEELFLPWALNNVLDFCDRIIIAENGSSDGTSSICREIAARHPHIEVVPIQDAMASHNLISGLAGQRVWVFGVDGDEVYDAAGLSQLRQGLLRGDYDDYWRIIGHSLHAQSLDFIGQSGTGYMSPPSKSVTKLYNFRALQSWNQRRQERLHGGQMVFKPGFGHESTLHLDLAQSWNDSIFRCVHLCFFRRTSTELGDSPQARLNPLQVKRLGRFLDRLGAALGIGREKRRDMEAYKQNRYALGDTKTADISAFGAPDAAHPDPKLGALARRIASGVE